MKTCLGRLIGINGKCKDCKVDYEPISPTHPFNNYNCRDYREKILQIVEVVEANGENSLDLNSSDKSE